MQDRTRKLGQEDDQEKAGLMRLGSAVYQVENVRFGSLADISGPSGHVRFIPESGHSSAQGGCPKSAKNRHLSRHHHPFGVYRIGEM